MHLTFCDYKDLRSIHYANSSIDVGEETLLIVFGDQTGPLCFNSIMELEARTTRFLPPSRHSFFLSISGEVAEFDSLVCVQLALLAGAFEEA